MPVSVITTMLPLKHGNIAWQDIHTSAHITHLTIMGLQHFKHWYEEVMKWKKLRITDHLYGESTDDWWIHLTNDQYVVSFLVTIERIAVDFRRKGADMTSL